MTGDETEKSPIAQIDVDEVVFTPTGREWEIRMVRDGRDDVYHYTEHPDMLFEQLTESGDIDVE